MMLLIRAASRCAKPVAVRREILRGDGLNILRRNRFHAAQIAFRFVRAETVNPTDSQFARLRPA